MKGEKFKKLIMDNYKLVIPIALLLVIFLAFIIYYFISRAFPYSKMEVGTYYQYFSSEKIVYDIDVTYDKYDAITEIKPKNKNVSYDSRPIYDNKDDIVIFPSDMSVVMPVVNCSEYFVSKNSYVKYENKRYSLISKKYNEYLGHYFFYDGEDLYFFIEDVTLVNGSEEIELSPFSYVIVGARQITYYDKKSDTIKSVDKGSSVYVKNDYYTVYVDADYIDYYGERVILTSDVTYLSDIKEMKR